MANIFDYIWWRGDLDFISSPYNPADNIIFSQLSYLALDGIVPGPDSKDRISISHAAKIYHKGLNKKGEAKIVPQFKEDPDLIKAIGESKRFGDCYLFGYVNYIDTVREVQFSAVCAILNDGSCTVIYRGTDVTLIGWKEDFNMCFRETIPSQLEALNYLEKMSRHTDGSLRVCGHSKGGNLAVYAASQCGRDIQDRITDIYSNDSPGFHENIIKSPGFKAVNDRIHSYVPQSSIIGMLLENSKNYSFVKSRENGILQHIMYSWEFTHNDLVRAEKPTESSRFINKTLREWLSSLDNEHRQEFIEAFYHILTAADVNSFAELENSWFTAVGKVMKSLGQTNESKKKLIKKTLRELFVCAGRNLETLLKQKNNE